MKPALLKSGDKVGIVAPSRVIDRNQMKKAYDVLSSWGLHVINGEFLYSKEGYFAGTDEQRLTDLQQMIDDPTIKSIFCARGGYGMTRIIDMLDLDGLKTSPKWVIGFSDITALHLALHRINIESVHGLMPVQFGNHEVDDSIESLRRLLFEGDGVITSRPTNCNVQGKIKAQLTGGNLSLVVESLGTKTEINTDNKLLFLEEIDEYLYRIDRMFNQLYRAGKFNNLRGLIIGDFSSMKDTQIPFGKDIYDLISHYAKNLKIPVAFDVPIGHEDLNMAVPVSREVDFVVTKAGSKITF